ncbi:spore coat protein [Dehalobacterium formicoaceticum]|uniref:Spore coat protein n=1 Tax=Dehalobacterium formicoaceticum TaxID=51515 RepID=A0ABT1XZS4_9FIRM|nr:spore coat protein [Dehalobacterium formicoaceticum]MCR6544124.1 spore coat protein [Dehalobacterium formicoaceticum]
MPQKDKSIASECLLHQKYLADSYTGMARETACDALFTDVLKICQEELQANHQIFNFMNQQGWYQVQNADQNQITQAQSQIQQMQSQSMQ